MSEWTREALGKRTDEQIGEIADRICNRLANWRSVFAARQLGTRPDDTAPESQGVRLIHEATILLRAELNALTACCVGAGLFTAREYTEQVIVEAEHLSEVYAQEFPGMTATDEGIAYVLPEAEETMRKWLP